MFARLAFCAFALFVLLTPLSALAEQQARSFDEISASWHETLDAVREELSGTPPSPTRTTELQNDLNALIAEADAAERRAQNALTPLGQEREALGPPPAEGEPEERPEITEARQNIQERIAVFESRLRQAQLAETQANVLLRDISRAQQEELTAELLTLFPSPLEPQTWLDAFGEAVTVVGHALAAPLEWYGQAPALTSRPGPYFLALLAFLLAGVLAWPVRLFLKGRFGRDPAISDPSYTRRLLAVVVDGAADALLPLLALAALAGALIGQGLLTGHFAELIDSGLRALAFFLLVAGLARAALSPKLPAWRIVPTSPDGAVALANGITAFAAANALFTFGWDTIGITMSPMPEALASVFLLIAITVVTILLMGLLPSRFWPEAKGIGSSYWPAARLLIWLLLAAAPLTALAGYAFMGGFLLSRLMFFALLLGGLLLLRAILREGLEQLLTPEGGWFEGVTRSSGLSEQGARVLLFWVSLAIDAALVLGSLYMLLNLLGVPSALLNLWTREIVTGFEIGGLTISPLDFVLAVIVFLLALATTGIVKRLLSDRLLPQTRLDIGVRHSIVAASGYVGVILALLLGVAALGLDLSNIAIIAGALSVGIGFGLREVVNNFVSGLLLLIERPVKVGDWIVTAGHEGMVKHISVRATEIETFDRASVILPNSELVTQPVTNWTHKNRVARTTVKVGVAYGSDTQLVHDLLLSCAQEHPDVLDTPAAYVLFRNFGDSALEFELRAYVRDTDYYLRVGSDLHFAVDRVFREHKISIPFPQRDLHIVTAPGQAIAPGSGPAAAMAPRGGEVGPEGGSDGGGSDGGDR
ncbi:DUF3772 domain-containing protein [Algihabitans albus]|uniref:DUF3772 domain-containing protein n=1 Tax=Algihabitans albus TaxID=2164067 RepID=UPI0013C36204|nr:DUF3772 domain-containing protein [Algihabitans albus]